MSHLTISSQNGEQSSSSSQFHRARSTSNYAATMSESSYLQRSVGRILIAGITQILASRCEDPVDALGRFLLANDAATKEFEAEEYRRAQRKAAAPTLQELEQMKDRFKRTTWTLENVDAKSLFRPPTPKNAPITTSAPLVEASNEDTPETTQTGISAVDNAISASQELGIELGRLGIKETEDQQNGLEAPDGREAESLPAANASAVGQVEASDILEVSESAEVTAADLLDHGEQGAPMDADAPAPDEEADQDDVPDEDEE